VKAKARTVGSALLIAPLATLSALVVWEFLLALNVRVFPSHSLYPFVAFPSLLALWRVLHPKWVQRPLLIKDKPPRSIVLETFIGIVGCLSLMFLLATFRPYLMIPASRPAFAHTALEQSFPLVAPAYAAVLEEIVFRGILQSKLESQLGVPCAITISSVLFTLSHVSNHEFLAQWPFYLTLSVFVGVISWRTQSLLLPIVIHLAVNLISNAVVLIAGTFDPRMINPTASLWLTLVVCSALGSISLLEHRLHRPELK